MTTLFRMTALLRTTTLAIGPFEAFCSCVFLPRSPQLGYILSRHEFHSVRLDSHRSVSRHHPDAGTLLPLALGQECGRLLRLRPERFLVAGRHLDGGDHIRR